MTYVNGLTKNAFEDVHASGLLPTFMVEGLYKQALKSEWVIHNHFDRTWALSYGYEKEQICCLAFRMYKEDPVL